MKKFLTVLLVIAVMFTFSFSSAFAAPVDKTPITNAQAAAYTAIEKAGEAALENYVFEDGLLVAYYTGGTRTTTTGENQYITDAVVKAAIADAVEDAKLEVQKVATNQSASATDDEAVKAAVVAIQNAAVEQAELVKVNMAPEKASAALVNEQLKVNVKAAKEELNAYATDVYSDDVEQYAVAPADSFGGQYTASVVSGITEKVSAQKFAKELIKTQLAVVTADSATLTAVAAATKTVKDILKGHKITDTEKYYIEALPTLAELEADTSVDAAKSYAINKMEAALAAKIADMKEIAADKLAELNKLAKPNADTVAAYEAFLAGIDAQATAAKEVYTAQINAQKTTSAVYTKDSENKVNGGKLKAILDEINGFTAALNGDKDEYTCTALEAKVKLTKEIDELESYAAVLASLVDREGKVMYDTVAINSALAEAKEAMYLGEKTLDQAKAVVDAAANVADKLIAQKSKYINSVEGAGPTLTIGSKSYKVWNDADKYEAAQLDAYNAVVKSTTDAILAAQSYDAIVNAYLEGYKVYDEIITIDEHKADWARTPDGKLRAEYVKNYKQDVDAYVDYTYAKLDATDDSMTKAAKDAVIAEVVKIIEKAYTKDEISSQVAAAKAYLDALKSDAEIKAAKAEVEALIAALPTNVTLADKEKVLAAKKANEDYKEIPGAPAAKNELVLKNSVNALKALEKEEIQKAVKELQKDAVTVADAEAIGAVVAAADEFKDNYDEKCGYEAAIKTLKAALSDAQVKDVALKCAALSLNPVDANAVKAVRDAFNALDIHQQAKLITEYNVYYDKLSQAEKNLGDAVEALKIKASSKATKGAITVKWTVKGNKAAADGFQVWKSTKAQKGYKKAITTKKTSFKNTKNLKKGTRYYYKVRAYKVVDGVKYYSDWSNKANRIAK